MNEYQTRVDAKMAKIKNLDELAKEDKTIGEITKLIAQIYKLDFANPAIGNQVAEIANQLLAHYCRISNKSALKRAERNAKETSFKETVSALMVWKKNDEIGITEAKAQALNELTEESNEQVEAEYLKDAYEYITEATKMAIMFSQSLMRENNNQRIMSNIG